MHVMKKIVLQALDVKTDRKDEEDSKNPLQQAKAIKEPPTAWRDTEQTENVTKGNNVAEMNKNSMTMGRSEMHAFKRTTKRHLETVQEETCSPSPVKENFQQDLPVYPAKKKLQEETHSPPPVEEIFQQESPVYLTKKKPQRALQKVPETIEKSPAMRTGMTEQPPITMKEHLKAIADTYEYSPLMTSYDSELPLLPTPKRKKSKKSVKISPTPSKGAELRGRSSGRASTSSHVSRLSSGFGSLQDEGSTTVLQDEEEEGRAILQDEWTTMKVLSSQARKAEDHPTHYTERSSHDLEGYPLDHRGNPIQAKGWHRKRATVSPTNHSHGNHCNKPQAPRQAWTTPDLNEESPPTSSAAPSSDGRRSQMLAEKQEALQRSKLVEQKLAKNVQLLNLKVAEEQLS